MPTRAIRVLLAGALAACAAEPVPVSAPIPSAARPQTPADGVPAACPRGPARVERSIGSTVEYLGADPANSDICLMRRAGVPGRYYFAIYDLTWPGAEEAYPTLKRVLAGPTGTTVAFDTSAGAGLSWHDVYRNEGVEDIRLVDGVHKTLKIAHERIGYDGNTYRSIVTQWKDFATGMIVYQTYTHIAGRPEPNTAWDARAIITNP